MSYDKSLKRLHPKYLYARQIRRAFDCGVNGMIKGEELSTNPYSNPKFTKLIPAFFKERLDFTKNLLSNYLKGRKLAFVIDEAIERYERTGSYYE